MASHLLLMALFSLFVSLVFAVLMRETPREQLRLGGMLFAGFMLSGLVLGWLMYPFRGRDSAEAGSHDVLTIP